MYEIPKNIDPLPQNRSPLQPNVFIPLPLGAVRPRGWLKNQLEVQANGLTGHLDEIWEDVGPNSGWLGGTGESWERGPYYCDGLIPLAYTMDSQLLIAKAHKWINWVINSLQINGQFGPTKNADWWPRMVMLKVLTAYHEAEQDPRVLELMTRYFRYQNKMIAARPFENWSMARGADNLLSILWLFNITGEVFLLELAQKVISQTGDWASWQGEYRLEEILVSGEYGSMFTHVVNNSMGIKAPAVAYLVTGDTAKLKAVLAGIDNLMKYHGQPNGIWSGDEHLNGTAPTQGTELCAVAEYMFSLEETLKIMGDPSLADRVELVTYNAFPATFKPDMWAHQYDQQVNQVLVSLAKRNWANNNDESNIYGFSPNFACCTANMHQGWPKFVKNLVMVTPDNGLALIVYGPCEATVRLNPNIVVKVEEETLYPFDGLINFKLTLSKSASFPIILRVPEWAESGELKINGENKISLTGPGLHTVTREWENGDTLTLDLPMKIRITQGHEGLVSIYRGPLLFGLKIGEEWRKLKGVEPYADWEVYPTTPWNYGLILDLNNPEKGINVEIGKIGSIPFEPKIPPVRMWVKGRRLSNWTLKDNSAGPISVGPHSSCEGIEKLELIPYGSTNLRIAAFPLTTD